jgi:hypothetical protein
MYTVRFRFAV